MATEPANPCRRISRVRHWIACLLIALPGVLMPFEAGETLRTGQHYDFGWPIRVTAAAFGGRGYQVHLLPLFGRLSDGIEWGTWAGTPAFPQSGVKLLA